MYPCQGKCHEMDTENPVVKEKCISIWEYYRKVDTNEDAEMEKMYPC